MTKTIHETFTDDLHYTADVVSLETLCNENGEYNIEEQTVASNYYNKDELILIWNILRKIYPINDEHYIIMYLMYDLGLSYRKVASIIGRGPSFVFLYTTQAVQEIQKNLEYAKKQTITSLSEPEGPDYE